VFSSVWFDSNYKRKYYKNQTKLNRLSINSSVFFLLKFKPNQLVTSLILIVLMRIDVLDNFILLCFTYSFFDPFYSLAIFVHTIELNGPSQHQLGSKIGPQYWHQYKCLIFHRKHAQYKYFSLTKKVFFIYRRVWRSMVGWFITLHYHCFEWKIRKRLVNDIITDHTMCKVYNHKKNDTIILSPKKYSMYMQSYKSYKSQKII